MFRTLFYLPSLARRWPRRSRSSSCSTRRPGRSTRARGKVGIHGPLLVQRPDLGQARHSSLLALWGIGDLMIILLASLLDVPKDLYEAAAHRRRERLAAVPVHHAADHHAGAACSRRSPASSQTLQYFTRRRSRRRSPRARPTSARARHPRSGYPDGSTLTFPQWLYIKGFQQFAMGYASRAGASCCSPCAIVLHRDPAAPGRTRSPPTDESVK